MKLGILRIGDTDLNLLERVRENLNMAFPGLECEIISDILVLPPRSF